jgi:hypothetical protein
MNGRNGSRRILVALALAGLVAGMNAEAARPPVLDDLYRGAQLASHRAISVAVLPVVAVSDDPTAERLVEASWVALYQDSKTRWMPANEVRTLFAKSDDGSGGLAREVNRQIWRNGAVEPEMAGRLTRLLGVHAVLSVRIDRWEIADGGRGMVGMTAVLTDRDGTRLWSISGIAGHGRPPTSAEQNFDAGMSRLWSPDLVWRENGHNVTSALYALLARWAWSLPAPLYAEEESGTPLIAGDGVGGPGQGLSAQ